MNLIYIRVSKGDPELQDLGPQLAAIKERFILGDDTKVIEDRGTAYDIQKLNRRKGFQELLNILFDKHTLKDIFNLAYPSRDMNLYIWDYHRLIRNFEYNLFFGLLCDFFNVQIYSYKQGHIKRNDETPINKFSRYILYSINAFSSEDYSYNISTNVKKTVNREGSLTVSHKGKKWGARLVDPQGNRVNIPLDTLNEINALLIKIIKQYDKKGAIIHYSQLQDIITKKYDVRISKSYITRLKQSQDRG